MLRSGKSVGEEDGLVVNVSSPDLCPHRRLPVMVWIHGGGWEGRVPVFFYSRFL